MAEDPLAILIIVIGEVFEDDQIEAVSARFLEGLAQWNYAGSEDLNLNTELLNFLNKNLKPVPVPNERHPGSFTIRSEAKLLVDILIHPHVQFLCDRLKWALTQSSKYKHIIHAGSIFQGSGSWIFGDGTFSLHDLARLVHSPEVAAAASQTAHSLGKVVVSALNEGEWSDAGAKQHELNSAKLEFSIPAPKGSRAELSCSSDLVAYLRGFVQVLPPIENLLKTSDIVGNLRFARPSAYIFPSGQGSCALFGVDGFYLLLDGGYQAKTPCWDFVRHLDRLDAVLFSGLSAGSNLFGFANLIKRKAHGQSLCPPQLGYAFGNFPGDGSHVGEVQSKNGLIISPFSIGNQIVANFAEIGIKPHPLASHLSANKATIEPIILYQKLGCGSLEMFVLNPAKDSKELKDFFNQWEHNVHTHGQSKFSVKPTWALPFPLPLSSLASVAALIVWRPADAEDSITRILYTGSCPQDRIFSSLEKLKHLRYLQHSFCTEATLFTPTPTPKKPAAAAAKPAAPAAKSAAGPSSAKARVPSGGNSATAAAKKSTTPTTPHPSPSAPHASPKDTFLQSDTVAPLLPVGVPQSVAHAAPLLAGLLANEEVRGVDLRSSPGEVHHFSPPQERPASPVAALLDFHESPPPSSPAVNDAAAHSPPALDSHVEHPYNVVDDLLMGELEQMSPAPILEPSHENEPAFDFHSQHHDAQVNNAFEHHEHHHEHHQGGENSIHTTSATGEVLELSPTSENQEEAFISMACGATTPPQCADFSASPPVAMVTATNGHVSPAGDHMTTSDAEQIPVHSAVRSHGDGISQAELDELKAQWGEPLGLPAPPVPAGAAKGPGPKSGPGQQQKSAAATTASKTTTSSAAGGSKSTATTSKTTTVTTTTTRVASASGSSAAASKPAAEKSKVPAAKPAAVNGKVGAAPKAAPAPPKQPAAAPPKAKPAPPPAATAAKAAGHGAAEKKPAPTTKTPSAAKTAGTSAAPAPIQKKGPVPTHPFYFDLAFIPHNANPHYANADFFKFIRSKHYVLNALAPSRDTLEAFLAAKIAWAQPEEEVTLIPTHDSEDLALWIAFNHSRLLEHNVNFAPSAERCTLNLQDQETCAAYKLEF